MKSIKRIYKSILKNGGYTHALKHKSGYMVSCERYEKTLKNNDFKAFKKAFKEYIKVCKSLGGYVGAWFDNNIIYLDISYHYNNALNAIKYGKQQHQKAIYNITTKESIYIK